MARHDDDWLQNGVGKYAWGYVERLLTHRTELSDAQRMKILRRGSHLDDD